MCLHPKIHLILKLNIGLTLFVNECCSSPNCLRSNKLKKKKKRNVSVEQGSTSPAN